MSARDDDMPFAAQVTDYLDYCARNSRVLSPKSHPTEDGAVKDIPHRGHRDRQADATAENQIRATFRALSRKKDH